MDTRSPTARPAHRSPQEHDRVAALASLAVSLVGLPVTAVVDAEVYAAQAARIEAAWSVRSVTDRPRAVRTPRIDHPPLTAESAVAVVAAVAMGSWIALGGAVALGYVLVRSAQARLRSRVPNTLWAAVEPGWRKSP
ncbi:hypothetical protein FHX81_1206 [Saccharothrix saharensis]|uniref:Uncharacterized protein n=1 Tax=Saccharothrix saharensis TaxID=571190 RepID=A0A543J7W9_9PSEU|nr:hypothetical protein [Saccharothrix saharensis]TQM78919.1 hypothetical protein FHX81_1206 [Saccharothrix saharensis]